MDRGHADGDGAGAGGIAERLPELDGAVSAVVLRQDWRPLMGLGPSDAGGLVEYVLANVVLERAVQEYEAARTRPG